ncbi:hypothetical protein AX14_012642 [Amanita brunnescens Koide BX004]|nr:hypothetical protein AX14_012642 [Amanita brunnescens Koide BX004]
MLSYTYRSQPSEQQPVPRMLSTRSSTGQEGYLFHPGNYDDHGTSFGNSESGATVACSPQAITMDEFECLHDSRHFPPAPSTNAPTVFTIDPKQLDRQAPPLIQGDESQGHASDHKDDPQSHASPSKLSQPEIEALLEQFEGECLPESVRIAQETKSKMWTHLQCCIEQKAVMARIPYQRQKEPDGQKRKVLNKFLKKKFPKLPDDLEAKYREECKTQWLTQKENETEWIENCIERTARNNKFCYDVNVPFRQKRKSPTKKDKRPEEDKRPKKAKA